MKPPADEKRLPKAIAEGIAQRRNTLVGQLQDLAKERDQILFEGQWIAADQVQRIYRRLKWRDRRLFLETVILLALMVGLAGFIGLIFTFISGLEVM